MALISRQSKVGWVISPTRQLAGKQTVWDCESSDRIRGYDGACSTPLTPSQESAART
jgi:hypothetical protein